MDPSVAVSIVAAAADCSSSNDDVEECCTSASSLFLQTSLDWCHDHDLNSSLQQQASAGGGGRKRVDNSSSNSRSEDYYGSRRNETIASLTGSILEQLNGSSGDEFMSTSSGITASTNDQRLDSIIKSQTPLFPTAIGQKSLTASQSLTNFSTDSLDKLQPLLYNRNVGNYRLTFDEQGGGGGGINTAVNTISNGGTAILLTKTAKNVLNNNRTTEATTSPPGSSGGSESSHNNNSCIPLDNRQANCAAFVNSSSGSGSGENGPLSPPSRFEYKQIPPVATIANLTSPAVTLHDYQLRQRPHAYTPRSNQQNRRPLSCNDLEALKSRIQDWSSLYTLLPKMYQDLFNSEKLRGESRRRSVDPRLSLQEGKRVGQAVTSYTNTVKRDLVQEIEENLAAFEGLELPRGEVGLARSTARCRLATKTAAVADDQLIAKTLSDLHSTISTVLTYPLGTVTNKSLTYTQIQSQICPLLYTLLSDGLKPNILTLFGQLPNTLWRLVESSIIHCGLSIELLQELIMYINLEECCVEGPLRFNAFVYGLLNLHLLPTWLTFLRTKERLLHTHYQPTAFVYQSNTRTKLQYDQVLTDLLQLQRKFNYKLDVFGETKELMAGVGTGKSEEVVAVAPKQRPNTLKTTAEVGSRKMGGVGSRVTSPSSAPTPGRRSQSARTPTRIQEAAPSTRTRCKNSRNTTPTKSSASGNSPSTSGTSGKKTRKSAGATSSLMKRSYSDEKPFVMPTKLKRDISTDCLEKGIREQNEVKLVDKFTKLRLQWECVSGGKGGGGGGTGKSKIPVLVKSPTRGGGGF